MSNAVTLFNVPNCVTLGRIALVPVVLGLFAAMDWTASALHAEIFRGAALFFYLVASFSDLFDGYLARRRKEVSAFGKVLDPLADKFLALSLMVLFTAKGSLPAWYTIFFMWRELGITTLRGMALSDGLAIAASSAGKKKTVYLSIGLGFLFVPEVLWIFPARTMAWGFLAVALFYSITSGWEYIRGFYYHLRAGN